MRTTFVALRTYTIFVWLILIQEKAGSLVMEMTPREQAQAAGVQPSAPNISLERTPLATLPAYALRVPLNLNVEPVEKPFSPLGIQHSLHYK